MPPKKTAKRKPRKRAPAKDGTNRGRIPEFVKDPTIIDRICAFVRAGSSYRDSCGAMGISQAALFSWIAKAERDNPDPVYVKFKERLDRARAAGKAAMVASINRAGRGQPVHDESGKVVGYRDGDWRASAHLLACIDPEEYSLRYKIEHSGPQGEPVGVRIYLPEEDPE